MFDCSANFPYMHYIVYKSPSSDKTRHHVTSSDVAKQPPTQQQEPLRHRHQHHTAMTSLTTTNDVNQQFIDVLRSRGMSSLIEKLSSVQCPAPQMEMGEWHNGSLPVFSGSMYSVSQKNPPWFFSDFFSQNGWKFFVQILHTYYTFLSTLDDKFLSNYLQL